MEAFYRAQRLDLVDVVIELLQKPAHPTLPRMAALPSLDAALIGVRAEKLDQLCSRDNLNEISNSLTCWLDVSPFLGLMEADEEDVRAKSDRAVSGVTRERVNVLRRWQEKQKEGATYRWVVDGFIICRMSLPDTFGTTSEPSKPFCQLIIRWWTVAFSQLPSR